MAVSWYRSEYTLRAIDFLFQAGLKTNIHYVLQNDTIAEALTRLSEKNFPNGISAVVFLLHKPVGLGSVKKMIQLDNKPFQDFMQYVTSENLHYKVGFDSCTIPALLQNPGNMVLESLDTCEAARWSAYVTPDLKLLPCRKRDEYMETTEALLLLSSMALHLDRATPYQRRLSSVA